MLFDFLKPKKKAPDNEYKLMIDALQVVMYDPFLESIFYNRESRITLLNTYSENLSELVDRAYRNELGQRLVAVNLHHYLRNTDIDRLKVQLSRLITRLTEEPGKINNHVKNDIQELMEAYELLKKG